MGAIIAYLQFILKPKTKKYLSKIEYHRDLLKCQGERESEQAKGT